MISRYRVNKKIFQKHLDHTVYMLFCSDQHILYVTIYEAAVIGTLLVQYSFSLNSQ